MGKGCMECGAGSATRVTVEYATGSTEGMWLCENCQAEYERGGLVDHISVDRE